MTTLWRTQRPRFPLYISDGCGRDYYIKFDNGGYWSTQFSLKKNQTMNVLYTKIFILYIIKLLLLNTGEMVMVEKHIF